MKKVRLAVFIGDEEYRNRLMNCMMKHYGEDMEFHVFEDREQVSPEKNRFDLWLLGDCEEILEEEFAVPVLYVTEDGKALSAAEGVVFTEKYQEINRIVEFIMGLVPEERCVFSDSGNIMGKTDVAAVYALSENEYQLPFSLTLGAVLGEQKRAVLVDLQENSGITQATEGGGEAGIEELLIMAASGSYSKKRLSACIGRGNGMDYVYPAENAENLCEAEGKVYTRILSLLGEELGYETIILNLGTRFPGFLDVLRASNQIYLLRRTNGLSKWREKEFMKEIERRGYPEVRDRIQPVEIPIISTPAMSFERLVEQWKWNEMGDMIRRVMPGAVQNERAM